MTVHGPVLAGAVVTALAVCAAGAVRPADVPVRAAYDPGDARFAFDAVPQPALNDAAAGARFLLVDGVADPNGGGLDVLHDGLTPAGEDQPARNFFLRAGSDGGRLRVDLGRLVTVRQVNTYSWHAGERGPQQYTLYASDGAAPGFVEAPARGVAPESCGWRRLARVDTRPAAGGGGGQHAVAVGGAAAPLGPLRHLLFDIQPGGKAPFGHTFFSEIDVLEAGGPAPEVEPRLRVRPVRIAFEAGAGAYRFVVDATEAPDLREWVERELAPTVSAWYPRLAELLGSEGYRPPERVMLRFRDDLGGTPAAAGGAGVSLNAGWFRRERGREAAGCVIHELVHVVQAYGSPRADGARPAPAPGWVVEGIADYVRWFLFEPQSRGAEITESNQARARYDGSYRVSANFLDWVSRRYDRELVRKLNAVAREGRYAAGLWREWTGKEVEELGELWLAEHRRRLARGEAAER